MGRSNLYDIMGDHHDDEDTEERRRERAERAEMEAERR
jgi:hypothetical protein